MIPQANEIHVAQLIIILWTVTFQRLLQAEHPEPRGPRDDAERHNRQFRPADHHHPESSSHNGAQLLGERASEVKFFQSSLPFFHPRHLGFFEEKYARKERKKSETGKKIAG